MFHSGTQRLIDYWRALAQDGQTPEAAAVDPAGLGDLLPRVFLLDRRPDVLAFRLVGEFVRDLHGRGLKGAAFEGLWAPQSRNLARRSVLQALREPAAVVLIADGRTDDGRTVALEIALAPLRDAAGRTERLLGLVQPTTPVARLYGQPVTALAARMAVTASGAEAGKPPLALAAVDGRRIA